MKDKIAKADWAIKKGPQMVQKLNDDTNSSETSKDDNAETQHDNKDKKTPRKHWTGVQMEAP